LLWDSQIDKRNNSSFRVKINWIFPSYINLFDNLLLPSSHNTWHSWSYYAYQCIILSLNILNNISKKIMKIWYFENTHWDEFNDILYDTIYLCILVEKYGQSKLDQNSRFSKVSTIAGWREYCMLWDLSSFFISKTFSLSFLFGSSRVQVLASHFKISRKLATSSQSSLLLSF